MLSAINYCHTRNIVHRDLKPENLLLDRSGDQTRVTIIDFGTAGSFTPGEKMNQKYGTPYYIAPEVLKKSYDHKCDLWSCGVILYILLCGYPPFNGQTDKKIIEAVLAGEYTLDEPEWHSVSEEAKNLVSCLLQVDPNNRISALDALNHPWIVAKSNIDRVSAEIATRTLRNLQAFRVRIHFALTTRIIIDLGVHHFSYLLLTFLYRVINKSNKPPWLSSRVT